MEEMKVKKEKALEELNNELKQVKGKFVYLIIIENLEEEVNKNNNYNEREINQDIDISSLKKEVNSLKENLKKQENENEKLQKKKEELEKEKTRLEEAQKEKTEAAAAS